MSAGYAKVEAIAKGLREADPALTEAQSIAKAYETPEGRAAAAEYRAERVSA
jgi:hypothetical protein